MEKNKELFLGIVLVFCVLLTGICCFWLGTKFDDYDKDEESSKKEEIKENIDTELSQDDIDNLGEMLFNKTKIGDSGFSSAGLYLYDNHLTYKDLSNADRLATAYYMIPDYLFEYNEFEIDEYKYLKKEIDLKIIEMYYHEIFGAKQDFKAGEFYIDSFVCKLESDKLICEQTQGGSGDFSGREYVKYENAKLNGDELYVYADYLGNVGNEVYNEIGGIQIGDVETKDLGKDELFNKFGDKASKYKLTFNQDANGNWYWVSTELVK